jgi:hypothetical protein
MVLPWSQRIEGRKISVDVLAQIGASADSLDVNADINLTNIGEMGAGDASLEDA